MKTSFYKILITICLVLAIACFFITMQATTTEQFLFGLTCTFGYIFIVLFGLMANSHIKLKTITTFEKHVFLKRLNIYYKGGSIKIHLILNDDLDEPHDHPWDYSSFLIIPYKEWTLERRRPNLLVTNTYNHKPFSIVKRPHNITHQITLYRIFNIRIPALTIGKYSNKKQLCSHCRPHGICLQQK